MAANSAIEWTDHTFNPWIGCTKVSPGCDHCYAARQDSFRRWTPDGWGGPRRLTKTWGDPLKWDAQAQREGRRFRVFCASLADVFDNAVPEEWRRDLFKLIVSTPHLDWLLLTKRIGNARAMLDAAALAYTSGLSDYSEPLPNVWIGATVVNQAEADRDVPKLLQVPARVRFLSVEPMLGPIDLTGEWLTAKLGAYPFKMLPSEHRTKLIDLLDWVIVGGESGPGARPMHPDWARSLRDQCASAGVPFLFKQWGEWAEQDGGKPTRTFSMDTDVGETLASRCDGFISRAGEFVRNMDEATTDDPYRGMVRIGKKAAGRVLDGRTHDEFPEVQ